MIIIAGHFFIPETVRDAFVAAHADLMKRARSYEGCLDIAISADAFDPERVNLFEQWESEAVLQAWRKISNPPRTGVEPRGGAVLKHHVDRSEAPF